MLPATGITSLGFVLVVVALLLIIGLMTRSRVPKGLRLPPGPPGHIIFGNMMDMPTQHEWTTFSEWAKTYGRLFYIKVLGQPMVFVNTAELAHELFEKRSSIYSDRCEFPMIRDLTGFDWGLGFMRYGGQWRRTRTLIHQKFHPTAAAEYQPLLVKHFRRLLRLFCDAPDGFVGHIRYTTGAIIMELVYALNAVDKDDRYLKTAERALSHLSEAGHPGITLVDTLPILKYVPEWFPGAGFRRKANIWRKDVIEMNVAPFVAVKKAIDAGTVQPSFTSSLLEELGSRETVSADEEKAIREAGSSLYAGGSDTTVNVLHTFILAMVLSPDVQRKAQAELDTVVGPSRLPEFEDRDNLPYIDALCKEVLRWYPLLPLGVAHATNQDDIYEDYFIPKGALIFGNSWQILHDETTYGPDTNNFKPERFLKPGVKHPTAAFGYGRRICPGRHFAEHSLFIAVASILQVFNIMPARDSPGKEMPVDKAFTSGFFAYVFRPLVPVC